MYGDVPEPKRRLKISFNAPVTLVYAALCVVATLLGQLGGDAVNALLFSTYRSSLLDPLTYVRFFTHAIGHTSWEHLVGNMGYILLLGPMLEEKYGSSTLVGVILVTAGVTGVLNSLLFPTTAIIGASGVAFAFILLASITDLRDGEIPLTFILVAVLFLGQQVLGAVFGGENVSYFGHIVGGLVGAGLGFLLADWHR